MTTKKKAKWKLCRALLMKKKVFYFCALEPAVVKKTKVKGLVTHLTTVRRFVKNNIICTLYFH